MSAPSPLIAPRISSRAPGLAIEVMPKAAAATRAEISGVPVFVGFGSAVDSKKSASPAGNVVLIERLVRWDATFFARSLLPAEGSLLREAVRGFFANGGNECYVLAVSPDGDAVSCVNSLIRVFRPMGPLADLEDVDLVCVPDAVSSLVPDEDARLQIQTAALDHCACFADRFAILDAPRQPPEQGSLVNALAGIVSQLRSEFGAMYFPWLVADASGEAGSAAIDLAAEQQWRSLDSSDEAGDGSPEMVPPCGHVAGVFARMSGFTGGYRAPANVALRSVLDTSRAITEVDRGRLNDVGINCITAHRAHGIQIMGARTLSGLDRYRYVSTVRVMIGLRRWIRQSMADLVFEPNTPLLWDRIRRRLVGHCLDLWRAGALAADAMQSEAFVVQCDSETNTLESTERAQVIANISLAPTTPAEFIQVQIIHDASGYSVSAA